MCVCITYLLAALVRMKLGAPLVRTQLDRPNKDDDDDNDDDGNDDDGNDDALGLGVVSYASPKEHPVYVYAEEVWHN